MYHRKLFISKLVSFLTRSVSLCLAKTVARRPIPWSPLMTQELAHVLAAIRESEPRFVAIRRDIHAHPELGFAETRTARLVAERLAEWGYDVTTGVGGTGVVGRL